MKSYNYQISFIYHQKQVFLNFADKTLLKSQAAIKTVIQQNFNYLASQIHSLEYQILSRS